MVDVGQEPNKGRNYIMVSMRSVLPAVHLAATIALLCWAVAFYSGPLNMLGSVIMNRNSLEPGGTLFREGRW